MDCLDSQRKLQFVMHFGSKLYSHIIHGYMRYICSAVLCCALLNPVKSFKYLKMSCYLTRVWQRNIFTHDIFGTLWSYPTIRSRLTKCCPHHAPPPHPRQRPQAKSSQTSKGEAPVTIDKKSWLNLCPRRKGRFKGYFVSHSVSEAINNNSRVKNCIKATSVSVSVSTSRSM